MSTAKIIGNKFAFNIGMVSIVIPVYKKAITPYEYISLTQCCKVLGKHHITFIKPHSLNIDNYLSFSNIFSVESFDDYYFKGIDGYNRLMLSEEFYRRFFAFEFVLIYQLDAFVFYDGLAEWCHLKYDYVGAPWLERPVSGGFLKIFRSRFNYYLDYRQDRKQECGILPKPTQFYNKVGNGGFSLRKVKKMAGICRSMQSVIDYYCSNDHHYFNEDVFWSLEVNRRKKALHIPHYKEALRFSVEGNPDYALKLNKSRLPFGCHAWDLFPDFWRPFFSEYGYVI